MPRLRARSLLSRKRRRSMRRSFLSWLRVPRLGFRDHHRESGTRLSVSASFPLTLGRSEFPAAPCPKAGGRPVPSVELKGPALRGCARGENREVWGRLWEESHAVEGEKEESGGCMGWGGGENDGEGSTAMCPCSPPSPEGAALGPLPFLGRARAMGPCAYILGPGRAMGPRQLCTSECACEWERRLGEVVW